jgi:hypothetical protein
VTMAPPGSSRPSLTYTDQTLEALLPAITPCLKSLGSDKAWNQRVSRAIFGA